MLKGRRHLVNQSAKGINLCCARGVESHVNRACRHHNIVFFFSVMLCCIAHRTAYCIVIPRKYIILHTQLASANEPIWYCYEMQLNHYTIRELHRKKCPSYGWWNTVADPNDVHNILYIYIYINASVNAFNCTHVTQLVVSTKHEAEKHMICRQHYIAPCSVSVQ